MQPITFAMISDHYLFLQACSSMVAADRRFTAIGITTKTHELYNLVKKQYPHLVVVDMHMQANDGFIITKTLKRIAPLSKVIGLSTLTQSAYAMKLLQVGGCGYLTRNVDRKEFQYALWQIHNGEKYVCREVAINYFTEKKVDHLIALLTKREHEVMDLVRQGFSNEEIGRTLQISKRTIETHRRNILFKLELPNTAALVNFMNNQAL